MNKKEMLESLINHYTDGNQAKFALKLGVPAQNISAWIKRDTFNAELIYQKCEGVSADWLLSGSGEMLRSNQQIVDMSLLKEGQANKELLELCKLLVANYQQRDEVMTKLVSKVRGL